MWEGKPLPLHQTSIRHRGGATVPSMVAEGKQQGIKVLQCTTTISTTQKLFMNSSTSTCVTNDE